MRAGRALLIAAPAVLYPAPGGATSYESGGVLLILGLGVLAWVVFLLPIAAVGALIYFVFMREPAKAPTPDIEPPGGDLP